MNSVTNLPDSQRTAVTLFESPIGRYTSMGAVIGVLVVMLGSAAAVVISDTDPAVMGVAGLAAGFGGSGFGAMLGAVFGGIRAATLEAEERAAAAAPARDGS
jgi:hypothetical protein